MLVKRKCQLTDVMMPFNKPKLYKYVFRIST